MKISEKIENSCQHAKFTNNICNTCGLTSIQINEGFTNWLNKSIRDKNMKTPIQKLIKLLEKDIQDYAIFNDGEKNITAILIKQKCEDELLELEKQMIIDAVNYGATADIALDTQYYEEKFNQIEIDLQKIAEVSNNSLVTQETLKMLNNKFTKEEILLFNKWLDIIKLRQNIVEKDAKHDI